VIPGSRVARAVSIHPGRSVPLRPAAIWTKPRARPWVRATHHVTRSPVVRPRLRLRPALRLPEHPGRSRSARTVSRSRPVYHTPAEPVGVQAFGLLRHDLSRTSEQRPLPGAPSSNGDLLVP
jgi:hypothetical protein